MSTFHFFDNFTNSTINEILKLKKHLIKILIKDWKPYVKKNHLQLDKYQKDIKDGKMVILVDDEDRENEGDLCMAAEKVTPEAINFMATYGRGLICLAMTAEKAARGYLGESELSQQVSECVCTGTARLGLPLGSGLVGLGQWHDLLRVLSHQSSLSFCMLGHMC
mgnify:CR=1 FL=1